MPGLGDLALKFTPRFLANPRLVAELASDVLYRKELNGRLDDAVGAAKAAAPVKTGAYKAGIEAEVVETPDGPVGRINGTDFKSHWVEWGTVAQAPKAPLRKGARAAGLRFEDTRK